MKILSYHHAFTSPLDTLNSRVYRAEGCYKHCDQTYLLVTFTKPGELNQPFGIQLIAESKLKDSMSTYLFTSSSTCPSFISVLPPGSFVLPPCQTCPNFRLALPLLPEVSHSRRMQWCKLSSLHDASVVQ